MMTQTDWIELSEEEQAEVIRQLLSRVGLVIQKEKHQDGEVDIILIEGTEY